MRLLFYLLLAVSSMALAQPPPGPSIGGGGPPSGAAGGGLNGTYPNPGLTDAAVNGAAFSQSATYATGTLGAKAQQVISVNDFGPASITGSANTYSAWAAAVAAAVALSRPVTITAQGIFRIDNMVTLASGITLDLTQATILPGLNIKQSDNANLAIFNCLSCTDVFVLNGTFSPGASTVMCGNEIIYGSTTCTSVVPARPINSVTDPPALYFHGSGTSRITVRGVTFNQFFVAVSLYDATDSTIDHNRAISGNAAFAVIAQSGDVSSVLVDDNVVISGSDDGICICVSTSSSHTVSASGAHRNYIDKTGLIAGQGASLGIRVASFGTGKITDVDLGDNIIKTVPSVAISALDSTTVNIHGGIIDGWGSLAGGPAILVGTSGHTTAKVSVSDIQIINPLAAVTYGVLFDTVTTGSVKGVLTQGNITGFGALRLVDSTGVIVAYNTVINASATGQAIAESGASDYNTIAHNDTHLSAIGSGTMITKVGANTVVITNLGSTTETNQVVWAKLGIHGAPGVDMDVFGDFRVSGTNYFGGLAGTGSRYIQVSSAGVASAVAPIVLSGTTANIGGGALLAGACTSYTTTTVTGATTAMAVQTSPVADPGANATWLSYVSATDTVSTKVCMGVAGTPTATTYNLRVQ